MGEIVELIKTHIEDSSLRFQNIFGNQDDIDRCLQFGQQAIHVACRYGKVELVKYLVGKSCKLDDSDMSKWKPLNWAIQNNNLEIVKILLENNCSIDSSHDNNWLPIHHACLIGNSEIVKLLIGKGCEMELCYNIVWRPIHIACKYGRFDIVSLLIQNKCDIDVRCEHDWRPIHYACYFGYIEIVKLLIKHHCNIEHKTANNLTAMDLALNNSNQELIEIVENWKLTYEIAKAMDLQCDEECDHQFCRTSLYSKTFKKERIGKGSFGTVYLCNQSNSDKKFAMKKISITSINKDKKFQKYVENNINHYREIISHPRIIQYFGAFVIMQNLCIFMEYSDGGSLSNKIQENLSHGKIISYTQEILQGVELLHKKKIIHRDIKPGNILLDKNDNIKLCDFGLSRSLEDPTHEKSALDASTVCGTQFYMAPEILTGGNYKFSGDIWSIGATVIEMVSGKPPYFDIPAALVVTKIMTTKKILFQPLIQMSKELESLIEAMLNPDYEKRSTASELLRCKIFDMQK